MSAALSFAIASAVIWGVGLVLLKRYSEGVNPATLMVFQYLVGVVLVGGALALSGRGRGAAESVVDRWAGLSSAAVLLVAGYLLFIAAVTYAGEGTTPTAAATAVASAYPVVAAVLSAPVLGESLGWNHIAAVGLFLGAVVLAQL